jgi:hypothetical protein
MLNNARSLFVLYMFMLCPRFVLYTCFKLPLPPPPPATGFAGRAVAVLALGTTPTIYEN